MTLDTPDFLVGIHCMTYNHHAYIEDAMRGFTMQRTTFPFVAVIVDDASTDGEPEVILRYMNEHFDLSPESCARQWEDAEARYVYARHRENERCYFAVILLKTNYYSQRKSKGHLMDPWLHGVKYYALCEGDDYWTAPEKLQMQAEALENHQTCTISFCKVQKITVDKYIIDETIPFGDHIHPGIVTLEDYAREEYSIGLWTFHTSSFFYKAELFRGENADRQLFFSKFPYGDMPTLLWCLIHGNGVYVDVLGSCYRTFSGGYNSYVKEHPEFGLSQEMKLFDALRYLDSLTDYRYHSYIQTKLKGIQRYVYSEKIEKGVYLSFLLTPRNWKYFPWKRPFSLVLVRLLESMKNFSPKVYSMTRKMFHTVILRHHSFFV